MSHPDVVILCGGLGTRLRSVVDGTPKCLADVSGKPFLFYLLEQCRRYQFTRIILCTGYLHEQIVSFVDTDAFSDMDILFSKEESPLGTGGALFNAAH